MRISHFALLAAASLLAGGTLAFAHEDHEASGHPLVDARQGGMTMMVATLSMASKAGDSEDTVKRAAFPASGLASFARGLPALFDPKTANVENTRALPAVWEDSDAFAAQIDEFAAATAELQAAAQADDREAFTAALARTKMACQACHATYRAEAE